jgi:hypothetical protein
MMSSPSRDPKTHSRILMLFFIVKGTLNAADVEFGPKIRNLDGKRYKLHILDLPEVTNTGKE